MHNILGLERDVYIFVPMSLVHLCCPICSNRVALGKIKGQREATALVKAMIEVCHAWPSPEHWTRFSLFFSVPVLLMLRVWWI